MNYLNFMFLRAKYATDKRQKSPPKAMQSLSTFLGIFHEYLEFLHEGEVSLTCGQMLFHEKNYISWLR